MQFFRKKSFESIKEIETTSNLNKNLGAIDLLIFGIGAIIGSAVFVLTGSVAATYSGPAVTLSYTIAGVTCIVVALAYAEIATMLPSSGSIYTYSYIAFGEVFAWLIGSIIILELNFSAATVAVGWSAYIQGILKTGGIELPKSITTSPENGGIIDLPAVAIVFLVASILYFGTKDSKRLNAILVLIKMIAIMVFIIAAIPQFNITYWQDFMPFGFNDMLLGSSILFFAFTGFSTLAASAEECKDPRKDLMIGIIGSLVISTTVYIIIAALLTGIAPLSQLNSAQPLAYALKLNGINMGAVVVAIGAVCGMTTVLMVNIYGLSRIFYVIARDGLVPKSFAKLHYKYGSPYFNIIFFSLCAALMAGFCPYKVLGELSSMGALIDYIVAILIVLIFRIRFPNVLRSFKCPAIFIIAPLGLLSCAYLLFQQIVAKDGSLRLTGKLLIYWFIIMFILYLIRSLFMTKIRTKKLAPI